MYGKHKLDAYHSTSAGSAEYSDPYSVIGMLMSAFLDRMATARAAIERRDHATKGEQCGKAISILQGLQDTLDHQRGGEIAANLDALYDHMLNEVLGASSSLDGDRLSRVADLMRQLKAGWEGIAPEVRGQAATSTDVVPRAAGGVSVSG